MPKASTWKVKERIPRILDAIQKREDLDEVAKEFGITRRALNYNMASYDFQSSLAEFLAMDMKRHYETIQEFLDSDDPVIRAEGLKEHGKMWRALSPKLVVKRSENENITTVKMDRDAYAKLTREEQKQMSALLLKIDRENKTKSKPSATFIEGEYKVKQPEEESEPNDDAGRTP
jgi:hypothetical protein